MIEKDTIPVGFEPETLEIIRLLDEIQSNVMNVSNLSINKEDKEAVIQQIDEVLEFASTAKKAVKGRHTVKSPNRILAAECIFESWKAEIQMWIDLQDGLYDRAWNHLVDAQSNARNALRADELGTLCGMESHKSKLRAIEEIVFPNQMFFSPGMKVGTGICTICEERYNECPHIKTYPYNGEFCTVRIENVVDVDHVAIVDDPADKRARAMMAGERDTMTQLPIEEVNPQRTVVQSISDRDSEQQENEDEKPDS